MKSQPKTDWMARFNCEKPLQIKIIKKRFADIPAGASMLIVTPRMVDSVVRSIPRGAVLEQAEIRKILASQFGADHACPVTTGISLRVVAEVSFSQMNQNPTAFEPAPFWRAIDPASSLAAKLGCGRDFHQAEEGRGNTLKTPQREGGASSDEDI